MDWQPIETVPKDAPKLMLKFPAQNAYARAALSEAPTKRRFHPAYETVGRWWTLAQVIAKVGKRKAATGSRGALIERDGGYWGGVKKSLPLEGFPSHWRRLSSDEDFHPEETE